MGVQKPRIKTAMAKFVLGGLGSSLSGKNGNVVYVRTSGGVVVRNRPRRNNPQTGVQQQNRIRMTKAVAVWSGLDPVLAEAWRRYAAGLAVTDPESGLPRVPKAMNVFTGLYAKLLQLDPSAAPPLPPGNPFFGDSVVVAVQAADSALHSTAMALHGSGEPMHGSTAAMPGPAVAADESKTPCQIKAVAKPRKASAEPGNAIAKPCSATAEPRQASPGLGILFSADRPNSSGVVTELLLQRLPGRNCRSYRDKYRHQKFVAFTQGGLEATVPAQPGWYACGVRFVNVTTGQDTPVAELGVVGV